MTRNGQMTGPVSRHFLLRHAGKREIIFSRTLADATGLPQAFAASYLRRAWNSGQLKRVVTNPPTQENKKPGPPVYGYVITKAGTNRLAYYDKNGCRNNGCTVCGELDGG